MTRIINDPEEFCDDQLAGFADLYRDRLRAVTGGVVARRRTEDPKVAVLVGGGSGHYPAFHGLVGPGFATGAVVGNVFTSPSAAHAYNVAKAADQGRGVIFSYGNYAGDVMNFGIATKRLVKEGIDARNVIVTDDVASADEPAKRRGIAGDFTVFKVLGAAAERGDDLSEVERLGRLANDRTRSMGVAFSGCTMPGADEPLFTVPEHHMGLGLGIHGEPGIRDEPLATAAELAEQLVAPVLAAAPAGAGDRVAVIVNGLGTTKYEELFLLWGHIAPLLRDRGLELVEPEVGELVTSLDMGGCSLTLMWLDDELEPLWRADAYTPAYRKQAAPLAGLAPVDEETADEAIADRIPEATDASRRTAALVRAAVASAAELLAREESRLGDIDAIAGDGDHGRGMLRGVAAARDVLTDLPEAAGAATVLTVAGRAWAERAGGTSGVLWGSGLEAAGSALTDRLEAVDESAAREALAVFTETIQDLGGAHRGDKTMLDVLLPVLEHLEGRDGADAWQGVPEVAADAAATTSLLVPKVGRARPLAEKSKGHPDAGAVSMALLLADAVAVARTTPAGTTTGTTLQKESV